MNTYLIFGGHILKQKYQKKSLIYDVTIQTVIQNWKPISRLI